MPPTSKRYFRTVLITTLLAACGVHPTTSQPTLASAPTYTPGYQEASTSPTVSPLAGPTVLPTATALPAAPPKFPLDGYVMLFTKDGDLYFQDGDKAPTRLTNKRTTPVGLQVSDDNQKVIFSRGDGNEYSVNTDGTKEQTFIPKDWLADFPPGTNLRILGFVPGTHRVLFETVLCESQAFRAGCTAGVFLADSDTGDIKKLADPGLILQQNSTSRNIVVSPDGKMLAVGTMAGMQLLDMSGKVVRRDILPYTPGTPTVLFPCLFWLPDSSGVIAALPDILYRGKARELPAYTVWRYTIDNNQAVQIPLDPHPMGLEDRLDVSPDGNWIIYSANGDEISLYTGNLENGLSQILGHAYDPAFSWSPDSKHFFAGDFLGSIEGPPPLPETPGFSFLQWVDASHFTYYVNEQNVSKIRMGEIHGETIRTYDLGFDADSEASILIRTK